MAARSFGLLARCASALISLAGWSACADDGVSLHVICPIFPEIEDGVCTYEAAGDACVHEGLMNLALTEVYKQSFRVESGLKPRERTVPPRGETNGIQIRSALVDVRLPSGERPPPEGFPNPFRVVTSGYIAPEAMGIVSVELLTPQHYDGLLDLLGDGYSQIVIRVEIEGIASGGQDIKAGEYAWPVRLLNVSPPPCAPIPYCSSSKGQDQFALACE